MNLTFADLGLGEDDVEIETVTLESGQMEIRAHLTTRGHAIMREAAATYDLSPDDLFGRMIRHAVGLTPDS